MLTIGDRDLLLLVRCGTLCGNPFVQQMAAPNIDVWRFSVTPMDDWTSETANQNIARNNREFARIPGRNQKTPVGRPFSL